MRFDGIQNSFTAGEISPSLFGRTDLEKYLTGLAIAENVIVQPEGGLIKRGGSHYVAEVKDSSKSTILIEFNYKNQYSYILEFGNLYIRVYVNGAQVQDGGSPYEITTTYTDSEVEELRFTQESDTFYIVHKDHPPAKLTRSAHDNWTLANISFLFDFVLDPDWTTRTSAADNVWTSICWSPELTLFVTVASTGTGNRVMTSPDGITWTARIPATDNAWISVCWSPELTLFVAVAMTGTDNRVMTSPNGINWTTRTSAADNMWRSVCWSPELTLFVAVASLGASDKVMTSPDGVTWTLRTSAADNMWTSICWSPELTLFVAVAMSGTGNRVMTSPDGVTWTIRTSATDNAWMSVCWSPELTLFVAVAMTGTDNRVMTSPNGINWTTRTSPANNSWRSVCWNPELTMFVAVAETGTDNRVMTSPNGITWTLRTSPADNEWRSVCWSPKLTLFVAVAASGTGNRVMTNGLISLEWTANDYPTLTWFFEQRHFFASTPTKLNGVWGSRSADYTNMTLGTGLDDEGIQIVVKSATKFLWVSPGQEILLGGSNAEFKISTNSLNEAMTPSNIRAVPHTSYGSSSTFPARIDEGIVFVTKGRRNIRRLVSGLKAEAYSGTYTASNIIALSRHLTKSGVVNLVYSTSPDSIIWGIREDGVLIGVSYEPEHNVYGWHRHLIGGTDTKVKTIAVARAVEDVDNDELWLVVERIIDGSTVQYVEYIDKGLSIEDNIEDSFFVDSGITVTVTELGDYILDSDWVSRTSSTDNMWISVCWSPELTLFVAISLIGISNRVMTSPDGITWTTRTSAADNAWISVCWSPELTLFVAVALTGTNDKIMTSPDGITWTSRTSPADIDWMSVCWSPELTLFAAVAASGTGNRVMTSPDGINWTIRTSAVDNFWRSVCWSSELTLFVAVATLGTSDRVMTSPDGITWTARSAVNNEWVSVCWSPELTMFVAVAVAGTGNRVMTSPDGITWTSRTSPADNEWRSVCWSPEMTLFVAVAETGTNRIMTSPDGITWTLSAAPVNNKWMSVCWSPELILFVAVSETGTNDRVMTLGGTYSGWTSGSTLVANLDHLEGQEVSVLGDGAKQVSKTVTNGEIILDTPADKVHVGLPYTGIIETLPIEGGNPIGTSQTLLKRIKSISLRLDRSVGFKSGNVHGNLDEYYFGPPVMNEAVPLFTGDTEHTPFSGGYDRQSRLRIESNDPLPFNLLAIMYRARTE